MYKVITNKSRLLLKNEMISSSNLELNFTNFNEAYDFYIEHIKEHASHIGTITATRINHDIQLVEIKEDGTKLHYRLHLSN